MLASTRSLVEVKALKNDAAVTEIKQILSRVSQDMTTAEQIASDELNV